MLNPTRCIVLVLGLASLLPTASAQTVVTPKPMPTPRPPVVTPKPMPMPQPGVVTPLPGVVRPPTSGVTTLPGVVPQPLPPIYANVPQVYVNTRVIATFPQNTFLENIVVDPTTGLIFVTSYENGRIYRMYPTGQPQLFATVPGRAAGLAVDPGYGLVVSGALYSGQQAVFLVNRNGSIRGSITIPQARFLNGVVGIGNHRFLVADSYLGAVWIVNAATRDARIWYQHSLFGRVNTTNPYPGINGLKIYNGSLYATNTQRQLLLRLPVRNVDMPSGTPQVVLSNVNLDDFTFDSHGNIYATTHVYNSVVRIAPNGQITTVAGPSQGVVGSTAVAFVGNAGTSSGLYVTTNGGMSYPVAGGVQNARIVRLAVPQ